MHTLKVTYDHPLEFSTHRFRSRQAIAAVVAWEQQDHRVCLDQTEDQVWTELLAKTAFLDVTQNHSNSALPPISALTVHLRLKDHLEGRVGKAHREDLVLQDRRDMVVRSTACQDHQVPEVQLADLALQDPKDHLDRLEKFYQVLPYHGAHLDHLVLEGLLVQTD